ncbi:alpha/beta hydrolase [Kitasatospora sp. NPDC096077]|uniref:alpha/beta fold hydrolase n=1 Tax=Kitasatospora sp. NPDC096077 TaxID=3155544 RepID=UPI003329E1D4
MQALLDAQKLTVPVLGLGGECSMRDSIGEDLKNVAVPANVTTAVAPNANHWVMEENPQFVIDQLRQLLARRVERAGAGVRALPDTGPTTEVMSGTAPPPALLDERAWNRPPTGQLSCLDGPLTGHTKLDRRRARPRLPHECDRAQAGDRAWA